MTSKEMDKSSALRIQRAADKSGKAQDFKARAASAAAKNEKGKGKK